MTGIPQERVDDSDRLSYIDADSNPIDQEILKIISEFAGGEVSLIQSFMGILPYFSLFHTMYLSAISKHEKYILNEEKNSEKGVNSLWIGSNEEKWRIEKAHYDTEYSFFMAQIQSHLGGADTIKTPEVQEYLRERHMGPETRDRFFTYFTGGESQSLGTPGSCAWPLGCVQNLNSEEFPYSDLLGNQEEHGRPKSLREATYSQHMCQLHNNWKSDNPLFDLRGILYCIYGPLED